MSKLDVKGLLILLICFIACKNTEQEPTANLTEDIEKTTAIKEEKRPTTIEIYVWVDKLRLRADATTKSEMIATLKEGEALTFLDERSDFTEKISLRGTLFDEPWLKVSTKNGKEGWVYGGGVKFYKIGVDESPTPYDDCFKLQKSRKFTQANKCIERTQFRELKKSSSLVYQNSNGIEFKLLDDGKKHSLTNVGNDTIYQFSYYLSEMAVFVANAKYRNGEAYALVNDKTGETLFAKGFPKASTDGEHIAALNTDWKDRGGFNGIQIFGYVGGQLTVVYEKELEELRPVMPKWVDENTLQFTLFEIADKRNRKTRHGQLTRNEQGEWELEM